MAYFTHPEQELTPREPVFQHPVEDDWDDGPLDDYDDDYDDAYDDAEDDPPYDDEPDEPMTEAERRAARQGRFRVAAGVLDFFGVIAGTVVILILIALLVSLITWLRQDFDQTFTLLTTNL